MNSLKAKLTSYFQVEDFFSLPDPGKV